MSSVASTRLVETLSETASQAAIGRDIRALRKSRGFTLAELALKVGRSIGWMSQAERGRSALSINDLRRIAGALEAPISWFFAHEGVPEAERGYVVRAGSRRQIGSVEGGLVEELLSPDLGGSFEVVHCLFEPGVELAEPVTRPTEEAGYIVEGSFELRVGERRFTLGPGDSFRFKGEPHRWRNPGPGRTLIVWVIAPPVY
jgi:transcriptional regulator with XRE-family HTH domain